MRIIYYNDNKLRAKERIIMSKFLTQEEIEKEIKKRGYILMHNLK